MRQFKLLSAIGAVIVCAVFMFSGASAEEKWWPSKWGPQDELGAANYLSAAKSLEAAKLIKTGKTYSLGIEVNTETPGFPPRGCKLYVTQPNQQGGRKVFVNGLSYNDDFAVVWFGISSHIDSLGHVGLNDVFYNGLQSKDFAYINGLSKIGIEKIPPIVTRGVLLDMAAYFGVDVVKEGTVFNKAEIEGAAKKQGVQIREGDVVLLHTGWLSLMGKDDKRFMSGEPGIGNDGAIYLVEKGVVAVGADQWCVEVIPFQDEKDPFPVHITLLTKSGTHMLENINTAQLAADKAYEFLFVLGTPKYTGAVQMICNPIAIR